MGLLSSIGSIGGGIVGGIYGGPGGAAAGSAAGGMLGGLLDGGSGGSAAGAIAGGNAAAIQTQLNMYENMNEMLEPYRVGGVVGLQNMYDILGTNGGARQQQEINAIKNSPMYRSMLRTGENRIRANASATGGLRGGNTQAALAQFGPGILSQIIESQYAKYAGLAGLGENAAAHAGNNGVQVGANIGQLQSNTGSARAAGIMSDANYNTGMTNSLLSGLGAISSGTWNNWSNSIGNLFSGGNSAGGFAGYDPNDAMGLNSMYPSAYNSDSIF